MATVQIPQKFDFLFTPSRYKACYGGRGTGKSHSFATALVLMAASKPIRILCGREIQKSIKDSVKRLIDDKITEYKLNSFFTSTETEIRGTNGSLFLFAGIKTNPESIKSMEGIDICWIEEASTISLRSLEFLVPTIRKEGSEIWFTWNPENELDPVDIMFRGKVPPKNSIVQEVKWHDNPWFPEVLKEEMEFDRLNHPEKYMHVWEGGYRLVTEGAYYAEQLAKVIHENRVTRVPYDSQYPVVASFDLGISDMTSVWFAQVIGFEVRVIDFLESNGQPIDWYAKQMREKPYTYDQVILPHDGRAKSLGTGKSIEEVMRSLGFNVTICPNIAVKDGIDNVRSFLTKCWFDQEKCSEGLKHLRSYRENYDEKLRISRGPLHDEHSHAADSFRYLAVGLKKPIDAKQNLEAVKEYYKSPEKTFTQLRNVGIPTIETL